MHRISFNSYGVTVAIESNDRELLDEAAAVLTPHCSAISNRTGQKVSPSHLAYATRAAVVRSLRQWRRYFIGPVAVQVLEILRRDAAVDGR